MCSLSVFVIGVEIGISCFKKLFLVTDSIYLVLMYSTDEAGIQKQLFPVVIYSVSLAVPLIS